MNRLNLRIDTAAMQTIWWVLLLAVSANAANYTVNSAGGGNYTTIQACATAMAAGDTCTVYAGTYNEKVTVPAGTAGNYKTITVNGSDVVTVQSFTLNSHTKLIGNCASAPSAVNTCGFNIQNPSAPGASVCVGLPNGTTDVYIRNNIMFACSGVGTTSPSSSSNSYVYIQGNTISWMGVPGPSVLVNTTGSWAASSATTSTITNVPNVGGAQNGWNVYGAGLQISQRVYITGISGSAGNYTLTVVTAQAGAPTPSSGTNVAIELAPPESHAITLRGNHFLVENNDISHQTYDDFGDTTYDIIRNNKIHDLNEAEASGNAHTDAWYFSTDTATQPVLIEGEYLSNTVGPDAKGLLTQGQYSPCSGCDTGPMIFRFNVINGIGGGNTSTYWWYNQKLYNNTYLDVGLGSGSSDGSVDMFWQTSRYGADINNIFYFSGAQNGSGVGHDVQNPVAVDPSDSLSNTTGRWGYSLAYCNVSGSSNCALHGHIEGQGTWTGDTGNIFGYANQVPTNNPNFANISGSDFHLQAGSPAITAGTYLTTVASTDTGSGTSLVVNDAYYFQDSFGLSNAYSTVYPDCISVGTVSNHVCVTAVNYTANTLTLASPISRSPGQNVYLYSKSDGVQVLTGAAPDMGAYPYGSGGNGSGSGGTGSAPSPPSTVSAVAH